MGPEESNLIANTIGKNKIAVMDRPNRAPTISINRLCLLRTEGWIAGAIACGMGEYDESRITQKAVSAQGEVCISSKTNELLSHLMGTTTEARMHL